MIILYNLSWLATGMLYMQIIMHTTSCACIKCDQIINPQRMREGYGSLCVCVSVCLLPR